MVPLLQGELAGDPPSQPLLRATKPSVQRLSWQRMEPGRRHARRVSMGAGGVLGVLTVFSNGTKQWESADLRCW